MMDAEVENLRGAKYGEVSARVNSRDGHRHRDTRGWHRRASDHQAAAQEQDPLPFVPTAPASRRAGVASVIVTSYLPGVSTRRMGKLAAAMGVTELSKTQVSTMAAELDELAESFCRRRLDGGPYTFLWIDALTSGFRLELTEVCRLHEKCL